MFKLCGNAEWKLCISIKFSNQKIRWNYSILCSVIKWWEGKWYYVCWLIDLKRYLSDLRIISFLSDQSLFTQFSCFFTQYFYLQRHEADVFRCMLTVNLAKHFSFCDHKNLHIGFHNIEFSKEKSFLISFVVTFRNFTEQLYSRISLRTWERFVFCSQ